MISKANEGLAGDEQAALAISTTPNIIPPLNVKLSFARSYVGARHAKPDMQSPRKNALVVQADLGFKAWVKRIDAVTALPNTFTKISGTLP